MDPKLMLQQKENTLLDEKVVTVASGVLTAVNEGSTQRFTNFKSQ
jgi:hypothetical protein